LAELTEIPVTRIVWWSGISKVKYYAWIKRYGKVNEHNSNIPRDHWLTAEEKQAILDYHSRHPTEGYRRLTYMMLDEDIVAVSATSVYRVLRSHNRLDRWNRRSSKKGTGFKQPNRPHDHWHIDIAYINVGGTFYYLCSVLDGCSRYIVHWEIRESMKEYEVEIAMARARERFPEVKPRVISDNGPQFIAKDFKNHIKLVGMTHVRITPNYPQSNGKIERWHKTMKQDSIRVYSPKTLEEAREVVSNFVENDNNHRLHSSLGYIAPVDRLESRQEEIWAIRDKRLEAAREQRAQVRRAARAASKAANAQAVA